MSLPRPSGIKQPSRIGRPSALPAARPQTPSGGNSSNHLPQNSSSALSTKAASPEPLEDGISTDDFMIGDRIWVSGNKPGIIAFIGDTQFAPGEWAGIVLDEAIGKNDGSVMGVRYFQCEPKRGVFSRLSKISHTPQSPSRPSSQGNDSNSSESKFSNSDSRPTSTNGTTTPAATVQSRPSSRLGMSGSKTLSTSSSSLHKASSAGTTPTGTGGSLVAGKPGGVKVGDRVLVSGSKQGILRFIGDTDFAKGVWAGVELEEPLGKNDGAVAGKRYFDCKPMHGLFAPVHKISQIEVGGLTPSPHNRPVMSTSLRSSRERSGSQDSVSSLSSTASSVSRSRVRLGVTSLANQYSPRVNLASEASKTGQRPNTLNLSATTAALQKALKEKEEHIEQLLRERDLERSEVARAAAHVDEAESELSFIKTEQSRLRLDADEQIRKYQVLIADLENEKQELLAFLEEEKRRVEDLQFQLEEETLKDDTESKSTVANDLQVLELERQIKKEKERSDNLEMELGHLKKKLEDQHKTTEQAKTQQSSYQDQIEELTHKLAQAETKIKAFETTRLEDSAKSGQINIALSEKQNRVKEVEDQLALQRREMSSMSQQLTDMKEELMTSNDKRKKQDDYIKELTDKLNHTENQYKDMMDEIRNANSNTADLQRQLAASKTKAEELAADRAILKTRGSTKRLVELFSKPS
uniref:CAP-Gly domain-containing protein n=2 Tax=Arion vulgaris TaxID=1028688 RepID=A0A0B7BBC7_9EUPU